MTIYSSLAPLRLYLMQVASLPPYNVPVPCYLIQTEDGKNIVIDSGLPLDLASLPVRPNREPPHLELSVVDQLAKLGLKPTQIDMLICTHFDVDHAGNHALFTNAECVVQRKHYEAARDGLDRCALVRTQWDHPGLHYRLVDGDTELLPGLTLLETSGHVPGHQSVLVHLHETGPILLTIDAVPMQSYFTHDRVGSPMDMDVAMTITSTTKLLDVARQERVALIVFGHDVYQWPLLKKLPEYYD